MIKKKSFSIVEYVITLVVIVAALVGMSLYIKRAISGRWRQSADVIGFGRQYHGDGSFLYDCRIQKVYSCGTPCTLYCTQPSYCTPTCFSLIGFGDSNISMSDACQKAIAEINSSTPVCSKEKTVYWCGWFVGYYKWEKGYPEASYYCGKNQPPF